MGAYVRSVERYEPSGLKAKHDKESDGKRLAEIAIRDHPALLQPLTEVLHAAVRSPEPTDDEVRPDPH